MVYKDAFVVVIKHHGRILRDVDGVVTLPFGSEYSILLRNRESRPAQVAIMVDNRDALDGKKLILGANDSVELDGWLHGNVATQRFRFIQKTQEVIEQRGDHLDDGSVRVEFRYEKRKPEVVERHYRDVHHHEHHDYYHHHYHRYHPQWPYWPHGPWHPGPKITWKSTSGTDKISFDSNVAGWTGEEVPCGGVVQGSHDYVSRSPSHVRKSMMSERIEANLAETPEPHPHEGVTVEGSSTYQQFGYGSTGPLEAQSHVIIIRLQGRTGSGAVVEKPVTVKTKLECPNCGRESKSNAKFCSECGTKLM